MCLLRLEREIPFELLACMHWEFLGSFKEKSSLTGYALWLNWNWRARNKDIYSNSFQLYMKRNFSETLISAAKGSSVTLH